MNAPQIPLLCPAGPSRVGSRLKAELDSAKCLLDDIYPVVCIYGGSRITPTDDYYRHTEALAKGLSEQGISVMSGGGPGIMEAANKGAQAGGKGRSIGLNIRLEYEQEPNPYQDLTLDFEHFSSRKTAFCKYAAAFVVMPGGFGTLDELFEVLTLIQTGKTPRLPVVLFGSEFWGGLVEWMQKTMLARGLISSDDERLFQVVDDVKAVVLICSAQVAGPGV